MLLGQEVKNGLPDSFIDTGDVKNFFETLNGEGKYQVVPYYEDTYTSHTFLKRISEICEQSASFKGAEKQIITNAFSGNPSAVSRPIPGLENEDIPELDILQKREFLTWMKSIGLNVVKVKKQTKVLSKHFRRSGNFWVHVVIAKEGNSFAVKTKPIHFFHVVYVYTSPGLQKKALIMPYWSLDLMKQTNQKIKVLPVSSQDDEIVLKETKKGETWETLVHVKNEGNDESGWYGRADLNAIISAMGSEVERMDNKVAVNSTALTATNLLFFEGEEVAYSGIGQPSTPDGENEDTEDDAFSEIVKGLRKTVSREGSNEEMKSLGAVEYANGTNAPTHVALNIQRDSKWQEVTGSDDEKKIYEVLGASREISGNQQTKSGLGSESLIARYTVLNAQTIEPEQNFFEDFWNWLISEIADFTGNEKYAECGIKFPDKISKIIAELKELSQAKKEAEEAIEEELEENNNDE